MSLVLSARRAERLEELAAELRRRERVEVAVEPVDLEAPGEPLRLWRRASDGRVLDLLVNNAGFGAHGRFDAVPIERLTGMVRVNCVTVMELAHAALADMRPRGSGGIINVASLAAFQPVPQLATYAATKAFVLSLSESLWAENRSAGVRVVALCPGRTPTEFQQIAGTGTPDGSFGVRPPEAVVAAALEALEAGRPSVVPGLPNRLASWAGRIVPTSILTRVVQRAVEARARR
jgi:hypothetical protein